MMMSEFGGLRPWEVGLLTVSELEAIRNRARDMAAEQRRAAQAR